MTVTVCVIDEVKIIYTLGQVFEVFGEFIQASSLGIVSKLKDLKKN